MLEIYHNPRCSKSRIGLKFLEENSIDYQVINYIKEGISEQKIKELARKINVPIVELLRTHEELFQKEFKDKTFSEDEWAKIIAENPRLLHRPIVVNKEKAVWAQPPEKIKDIL